MKEDYLWDKTGSDAGIEKLENALAEFRCRETVPPAAIPAKNSPAAQKAPRRIFSFSFAFASCAAFMLILCGVWFYNPDKSVEIGIDLAKSNAPEAKISLPENPVETTDPIKAETFQPQEKPKFTKAKNPAPAKKVSPQKAKFVKQAEKSPKTETLKLTEEEQYAYDQLMLALSITSSKLNLVREKVALNENPNILIRKNREKGRN